MAIRYRIDILPTLKKAGFPAHRLRVEKIIGERTIQQIRNGELVAWSVLDKVCRLLQCQPGDLLEYVESIEDNSKPETPVDALTQDTSTEDSNTDSEVSLPESEIKPAAQETSTEAMKRLAHEMDIARAYGADANIVFDRPEYEALLRQKEKEQTETARTGFDVMKRSAAEAQAQKEQGLKEEAARREAMAVFHEDMSDSDE